MNCFTVMLGSPAPLAYKPVLSPLHIVYSPWVKWFLPGRRNDKYIRQKDLIGQPKNDLLLLVFPWQTWRHGSPDLGLFVSDLDPDFLHGSIQIRFQVFCMIRIQIVYTDRSKSGFNLNIWKRIRIQNPSEIYANGIFFQYLLTKNKGRIFMILKKCKCCFLRSHPVFFGSIFGGFSRGLKPDPVNI